MEFETNCVQGTCACTTTGCPKGQCSLAKHHRVNVEITYQPPAPQAAAPSERGLFEKWDEIYKRAMYQKAREARNPEA